MERGVGQAGDGAGGTAAFAVEVTFHAGEDAEYSGKAI
jgi:hypothetical protein